MSVVSSSNAGPDQASRLRQLVAERAPEAQRPAATVPSASRRSVQRTAAPAAKPIIAIASGKGGVGKTVVSVHLSRALCQLGHRVTLLDADHGTANTDLLLRLRPATRLGEGVCRTTEATDIPGLRVVAGSCGYDPASDTTPRARKQLVAAFEQLGRSTDAFVVDLGAGICRTVLGVLRLARLPVIVTTPDPTALSDAYALYKSLVSLPGAGKRSAALLVNEASDAGEAADVFARFRRTTETHLGRSPVDLGWLPASPDVRFAVRERRLVGSGTAFAGAIDALASRCGRSVGAIGAFSADRVQDAGVARR